MPAKHPSRLSCDQIRWTCDVATLDFETTDDVDPAVHVVGQQLACDALTFGIECDAPGQNVYVRGARGTGRSAMVKELLDKLQPKTDKKKDYAYVHNFSRPQSPRLITLPPGQGPMFRKVVSELAKFIETGLPAALKSEPAGSQLDALRTKVKDEAQAISKSLEDELSANGLALVNVQNGQLTQTLISCPLSMAQPVPPPQLKALIDEGKGPGKTAGGLQRADAKIHSAARRDWREN